MVQTPARRVTSSGRSNWRLTKPKDSVHHPLAKRPPRPAAPASSSSSRIPTPSALQNPPSPPAPSQQLPGPAFPHQTVWGAPRRVGTPKSASGPVAGSLLLALFARPSWEPHQTAGHRKKPTLPPDKGADTRRASTPVVCRGLGGPLTSSLTSSPGPHCWLWQAVAMGTAELLGCDITAG